MTTTVRTFLLAGLTVTGTAGGAVMRQARAEPLAASDPKAQHTRALAKGGLGSNASATEALVRQHRAPAHAAPGDSAAALRELESYFGREAAAGRFSGAIAIGRAGAPLFQKAWGMADRGRRAPTTTDTKFNIGSMNKMFTGVAIAQLVAQGKLRFDDPLAKFYPDFPSAEAARKIRVEHLLTHTSGLGSYFNERYMRERPQTIAGVIQVAREDTQLAFEPGTRWSYSNTGFLMLGGIIEKVTGQSYFDYVREHIYEPAGMRSSSSPAFGEAVSNLALAYVPPRAPGGDTTVRPLYRGTSAGGGVSTVTDLLRFADALLIGKLVPREYVKILTTAKPEVGSRDYGYGFGANRGGGGLSITGHNGGAPGVFANLDIYPEQGYATALLMNNPGGGVQENHVDALRQAVAALAGVGADRSVTRAPAPGTSAELPPTPAGRAAAALLETVRRAGDSAAIRTFVTTRMDAEFQQMPMEEHVGLFRRMQGDFGGARIAEVRSGGDTAVEVRLETAQRAFRLRLSVEASPPHRIDDLAVAALGGQPGGEGSAAPAPPPARLDASARRQVVDSIARLLVRLYPAADTGALIASHLRRRHQEGAFDRAAGAEELARSLTQAMQAINGDRHLNVRPAGSGPGRRMVESNPEEERRLNYYLGEPRVLEGNVGYLRVGRLSGEEESVARLGVLLRSLENTAAMIIDLRGTPGGSPLMANALVSHFTAPGIPSLRVYNRATGQTFVRRTMAEVPGPRRTDVPLYVLVDRRSASAAEDVPFVLQNLRRATIVGERTAGAGRNNQLVPVGAGLVASISFTRVQDPSTGREWERVGVRPDREVASDQALDVALRLARQRTAR